MKNSGMLWWIGAFVLAAVAGFLTYSLLSTSLPATAASDGGKGNTVPIIVAAVDIPFRRSIGEGDLTIRCRSAQRSPWTRWSARCLP